MIGWSGRGDGVIDRCDSGAMRDLANSGRGIRWRRWLRGGPRLATRAAGRTGLARRAGLVHTRRSGGPVSTPSTGSTRAQGSSMRRPRSPSTCSFGLLRPAIRSPAVQAVSRRGPLYLLPLALALADALENITVAALALSYDGAPSPLAWLAALFTLVKTVLIVATMAATCVGGMRWLWVRRWRLR